MPCSPAQLAANKNNARASTGPRSVAGKERSRQNAITHGLTGEGIALPAEDAAVVAARFSAIRDELAPQTVLGAALTKRVAILTVRLDRFESREAVALARRFEGAEVAFDEARMAEVNRLLELLEDDPRTAARQLRRMPEGVDWMLKAWAAILADISRGDPGQCTATHRLLAERLDGRGPESIGPSRVRDLFRATGGAFDRLEEDEGVFPRPPDAEPHHEDWARREWARQQIVTIAEAHVAELKAHRETLDFAAIARDRARAGPMATLDTSKEGILARKYEAAAERALFRTLKELRQVEADAAELGSIFQEDPEVDLEPIVPSDFALPGDDPARKAAPKARADRPRRRRY